MIAILKTLLEMGSMPLTSLLQGSPEHYSMTGDKTHLTFKSSPRFVVEFNTYNTKEMSSMSLTTLLKGGPQML